MIDAAELRRLVEAYDAIGHEPQERALSDFMLRHASELLALVEADQWRPIESAPRDGQDILVYCSGTNEMFVGFNNPDEGSTDPSVFFYALRTDGGKIGCRPTHWRPLPPPPPPHLLQHC